MWALNTKTRYRDGETYNPLRDNWLGFEGLVAAVGLAIPIGVYIWWTQADKELDRFPEAARPYIRKAQIVEAKNGPYADKLEAIKNYMTALGICLQKGMDPLSNEAIGLKMQTGVLMDETEARQDVYNWYRAFFMELQGALKHPRYREPNEHERLLKRAALVGLKCGELAEEQHKEDEAQECIDWVLARVISKKPSTDPDPENLLTPDLLMRIYDHAADFCLSRGRPEHSLPLYVKALQESAKKPDCHGLTIMNNIAVSLQDQQARGQIKDRESRDAILRNAVDWGLRALQTREKIPAAKWWQWDRRDFRECNMACIVASQNLGELYETLGERKSAQKYYTQALELSQKFNFQQGQDKASAALAALAGSRKKLL